MTDLTSVAAVKAFLDITVTDDDDLLATLVTAYSDWIRSYTNRDFTLQDYDIIRSGRDEQLLLLPQWPVTAVTGLIIDGSAMPAQSNFGAYGYRFTTRGVVLDRGRFTRGVENIQIQFTAGFDPVPNDIAQACTELVAQRFKTKDQLGWRSKTLATEVITLETRAMPDTVRIVLDQYRNQVPL